MIKIMDPKARKSLITLFLLVLLISLEANAQNEVAIGSTTTKSNAILWLNGNGSQGLILPVVTNKSTVSSPDKGMILYDNADNKVWYRSDNAWVEVGGGGASTTSLTLNLTGNQLQLRDGTTTLSTVTIAGGTASNGAFMVWNGSSWQYATLNGDVSGANGALQVDGIKGKTVPALPTTATTQALVWDGTAWKFQALTGGTDSQTLTFTSPNLSISNGNSVNLSTLDKDAQTLSLAGSSLSISGGNAVTLPSTSFGNLTTATTGLTITGGTGAVAGTGTILAIQNATASQPGLLTATDYTTFGGKVSLGGDLGGTAISPLVSKIQGVAVSSTAPASNQVLQYNGTNWIPSTLAASGDITDVLAGTGLTGGGTSGSVALNLATSGVTQGIYGSATAIPQLTIDAQGRITAVTTFSPTVADGSITGGSAGLGVKIAANTITDANIASLNADKINAGTLPAAQVPNLDASKITTGTFTTAQIPNLDASKITTGAFNTTQIPNLDAAKITSGVLSTQQGGTGLSFSSGSIGQGQLLIGTGGAFAKANLTAANGINITNGAGSISIATSGNFGSQNLSTSGTLNAGAATFSGLTIGTATWPANGSGVLTNDGTGTLNWAPAGGTGTVTGVSVVTANGFTGSVANSTTTPAITVGTSLSGILKGNGTSMSVATAGTDYLIPTGSAALLTGFPILNQNTTGSASTITGTITESQVTNLTTNLANKVTANTAIAGATNTKITYDAKGLVTAGTTLVAADIPNIAESQVTNLVIDLAAKQPQLSGTGFIKATGSTISYDNSTYLTSFSETDPSVKAINGLVKSNGTTISAAIAGTDYLTPTGSAALLTGFPILNQNTTGTASTITGAITESQVTNLTTNLANKVAANTAIAGATNTKITYDAKGLVTAGTTLVAADIPNIAESQVTNLVTDLAAKQTAFGSQTQNTFYSAPNGVPGVPTFRAILATDIPTLNQNTTGNAATVTTNANLIGPVTSVGNTTAIANGAISNAMLANGAVANLSGINTGDQTTITGNAGTATSLQTGRTISMTGDVTYTSPSFDGTANVTATSTVTAINNTSLAGLATGILKNTTVTGVPSIAVAGDFPILNQNTTGNAATVTTNANLTGPVTSIGNATSIGSGVITNAMLANTAVANLSGTNTGDQTITLTGDVTGGGIGSFVTTIGTGAITSGKILDATIADIDVSATAAIAGTKIAPAFGAQNISNTGTLTTGTTGQFAVNATGNITKINNITTSFPASQGAAATILTNDGAGNLSWAANTPGAGWGVSGNGGLTSANFIGPQAGVPFNIKIGTTWAGRIEPATGVANTTFGYGAGTLLSSGIDNTAIGYNALASNTTAGGNTAVGRGALATQSVGQGSTTYNTGVGYQALNLNTTGKWNTAMGYNSGGANLDGNYNTFIGSLAGLTSGTAVQYSTAIGYNAQVTASNAIVLGGTGVDAVNVGIGTTAPTVTLEVAGTAPSIYVNGTNSGYLIYGTSGLAQGNPTFTTRSAGSKIVLYPQVGASNVDYAIGTSGSTLWLSLPNTSPTMKFSFWGGTTELMRIQGDGFVGIGTTAPTQKLHVIGNILASGTITPSDLRYKKSIKPLTNALSNVSKLNGVTYYYRTEEFSEQGFNKEKQIGVIAQEIEKIYPELVTTDANGYKAVDYSKLTPILVEAIKELNSQNEQLKSKLKSLESENGVLESKVTSFEIQQQAIQKDVEELKRILGMKASKN